MNFRAQPKGATMTTELLEQPKAKQRKTEKNAPEKAAPEKNEPEAVIVEEAVPVQAGRADIVAHHSGEPASSIRQFVTFHAGNEVFAVDMAPVQEIIRVPEVVRVPLSLTALEGLANLRGKVLPIISLRCLFGFPEQAHEDA